MMNSKSKKNILTIAGHDPTGGAGIQADIEAILSTGNHPFSIISALTAQNTSMLDQVISQHEDDFKHQLTLLLEDSIIHACKIGILGNSGQICAINEIIRPLTIPTVLDPVLCTGSGQQLMSEDLCQLIIHKLLPITTMITPNSIEAKKLSGQNNLDDAAAFFIDHGTRAVLITGTHEDNDQVINKLYTMTESFEFNYERLPHVYHGSGCTLSASLTSYIANLDNIKEATISALDYTWQTLNNATKQGQSQWTPNRFYRYDNHQ